MSLLGVRECPRCHRRQDDDQLCSACKRTAPLKGVSTAEKAAPKITWAHEERAKVGERKMVQTSLFGKPSPKGQGSLF